MCAHNNTPLNSCKLSCRVILHPNSLGKCFFFDQIDRCVHVFLINSVGWLFAQHSLPPSLTHPPPPYMPAGMPELKNSMCPMHLPNVASGPPPHAYMTLSRRSKLKNLPGVAWAIGKSFSLNHGGTCHSVLHSVVWFVQAFALNDMLESRAPIAFKWDWPSHISLSEVSQHQQSCRQQIQAMSKGP